MLIFWVLCADATLSGPSLGGLQLAAYELLQLRDTRAAIGAAFQARLQLGELPVGRPAALRERGVDLGLGDVEAGADLTAARLHSDRCLGPGHEQQAAVRLGRQLLLQ